MQKIRKVKHMEQRFSTQTTHFTQTKLDWVVLGLPLKQYFQSISGCLQDKMLDE